MISAKVVLVLFLAYSVKGQRPFFAGSRPIGYPDLTNRTTTTTASSLGDRFGEDNSTTTQRLPVEALGDKDLVDRLSKLPIDKQPFWFINWQAIEANRQKPQTYPQRPSSFAQPINPAQNLPTTNNGNTASNPIRPASNITNPFLGNRFADFNTNSFSSEKPNVNNFGSTNLPVQKQNEQKFSLPVRGNVGQNTNSSYLNSDSNKNRLNSHHGINSKPQTPLDAHNYNKKDFVNVNNDADKMYLNTFAHKTNENTDVKPSDIFKQNEENHNSNGNKNVKNSNTKNGKPVNVHPVMGDASDFGTDLFNLYKEESDFEGDFFDYLHAPVSHQQVPSYYSDSFAKSNKARH